MATAVAKQAADVRPPTRKPRVKHLGKARADKLYSYITEQIRNAQLKPGDPLLPSRRLCVECGISYRATLQALHRLQREGFIVCRPGAGTYVAEATNVMVGRAQPKTVEIIVAYLDPVREAFYRPVIQALQQQLTALECVAHLTAGPSYGLTEILNILQQKTCDATIVVAVDVSRIPQKLPLSASPTVFLSHDAEIYWQENEGYDVVTANSAQGGAVAGSYMRSIGVRHPAIIAIRRVNESFVDRVSQRRIAGFETGWGEALPMERIVPRHSYTTYEGALAVPALRALNPAPDAIFAVSDDLAEGCCHAFAAQGVHPGRDIKIVGFDAQKQREREGLTLTSIQIPVEELGRVAALMAVERAQHPKAPARWLSLACSLRMGNTT